MGVIESAVAWAIDIANDPRHGYSQIDRWGPNYDCSSFVISAFEQAGVSLREAGANTTRDMRGPMISCGFVDVTVQIGLDSGYGLQPGDVLLNYSAHTCMAIGGGKVANCRTDEGNPQSGDQSGNEIRIQNYWDGSPNKWNCVLRYKGSHIGSNVSGSDSESEYAAAPRTVLRKGMRGEDVKALQEKLNSLGYNCGAADGIFGQNTFRAVVAFQEDHHLDADGIAGKLTQAAIEEALKNPTPPAAEIPADPPADPAEEFWLPDLEIGSKNDAVTFLQAALNLLGFSCGKADGIFGPATAAALNRFKTDCGIEPNGKADTETWKELLEVLSE